MIQFVTFLGWWKRDPFWDGDSWLSTIGDEKVKKTVCKLRSYATKHRSSALFVVAVKVGIFRGFGITKGWASWGKSWCIFLAHAIPWTNISHLGERKIIFKSTFKKEYVRSEDHGGYFFFLSWEILLVGERFMLVNERKGCDICIIFVKYPFDWISGVYTFLNGPGHCSKRCDLSLGSGLPWWYTSSNPSSQMTCSYAIHQSWGSMVIFWDPPDYTTHGTKRTIPGWKSPKRQKRTLKFSFCFVGGVFFPAPPGMVLKPCK